VTYTAHYYFMQLTLTGSGHINANCLLVADGECPKIRDLLAEALAPTAFLEAGQHLLTMATAPPLRKEILLALRLSKGIPTAKAWANRSMPAGTTAPPTAEEIRKPSSSD
jgi:hypothetical protein